MEESERQIRIKLNERLVSSGAYATISQHLEKRLDETKWNEEIDKLAKDRIKDQIRQGGSIDRKQIADALMPIAMEKLDPQLRQEIQDMCERFILETLDE